MIFYLFFMLQFHTDRFYSRILLLLWGLTLFTQWLPDFLGIRYILFRAVYVGVAFVAMLVSREEVRKNGLLLASLVIAFLLAGIKLYTDTGEGSRALSLQFIGAVIVIAGHSRLFFRKPLSVDRLYLWRLLIAFFAVFFVLEVGLSLVERIIQYPLLDPFYEVRAHFRSRAFLGHPLYNALVVSTMMSFILTLPLRTKYKYALWGLGYVAILCFNTRSTIVLNALFFGLHLIYTLCWDRSVGRKLRKQALILGAISVIAGLILLFGVGLGSRLLEMGLLDEDSAQVRLDVWALIDMASLEQWLWGIDFEQLQWLMESSHIPIIENFWIEQALRMGLLLCVPYWIVSIYLGYRLYKGYAFFPAMLTSITFLTVASVNNSLAVNYTALGLYYVLILLLHPRYIYNLIPRQFLLERYTSKVVEE